MIEAPNELHVAAWLKLNMYVNETNARSLTFMFSLADGLSESCIRDSDGELGL